LVAATVAAVLVVVNTGNSPDPTVSKVVCKPGDLTSCLIAPPSGASVDTGAWAQTVKVDAGAYAAAYPDATTAQQPNEINTLLTADGIGGVAHRSWKLGPNRADLILLQFGSAQGAQAWAADRTGEFLSLDGGAQLSVPGDPAAKAYSAAATNGSGDVAVRYVTTVGNIDLEVHYASQGALHEHEFDLWAGAELASLQGAPAPAPSPSPTATAFEAATCPGSLASCLMPLPPDSKPFPGLPTTYTIDSYLNDLISQADRPAVRATLQKDQVIAIKAASWHLNTGAGSAQVVLVQTRTDDQAGDLKSAIGGAPDLTSTFTIPGYADASGAYSATPDATGFTVGQVDAHVGTVYAEIGMVFDGPFDTATAQDWAVQELNLLTQDTQGHWGFPIPKVTTPSLPAFAPGSCPASALTGCVMPLPPKSTAVHGDNAQDVDLAALVSDLFPDRQDYEQTWLTSDGAKDAATRSWTAPDGAAATDYVVRFGSTRQAKAATFQMASGSMHGSQSCAIASLPDLFCLVLPADNTTGAVPIRVIASTGTYLVDLEVTQTDAADTSDALSWTQNQLELLVGGN
jgi:hypothetical protein